MKKVVKAQKESCLIKELDDIELKEVESGGMCLFINKCVGLRYIWDKNKCPYLV